MYAIYGDIYHQYTPVMLAYIPYMDPMGYRKALNQPRFDFCEKSSGAISTFRTPQWLRSEVLYLVPSSSPLCRGEVREAWKDTGEVNKL